VTTEGGNYILDDLRDTPDTAVAVFDCPDYTLHYTVRQASGWRPHGEMDHGIEFIGSEGVLQINRRRFQIFTERDRDSRIPIVTESRFDDGAGDGGVLTGYRIHKRNFLECLRTREETVAAALPGHLANISYRLGRTVHWDTSAETTVGDEDAARMMTREYRTPWEL
jgi:hypothetical protein